jgi:Zn ribbon nucleic-acid-binding protein
MSTINECPGCGTLDTDRQMIDWMRDGVDVVYTCYDCNIDFVASLRDPLKEVSHRYDEQEGGLDE